MHTFEIFKFLYESVNAKYFTFLFRSKINNGGIVLLNGKKFIPLFSLNF